jgi:uncharacterized coiled-coil protein SlyX
MAIEWSNSTLQSLVKPTNRILAMLNSKGATVLEQKSTIAALNEQITKKDNLIEKQNG